MPVCVHVVFVTLGIHQEKLTDQCMTSFEKRNFFHVAIDEKLKENKILQQVICLCNFFFIHTCIHRYNEIYVVEQTVRRIVNLVAFFLAVRRSNSPFVGVTSFISYNVQATWGVCLTNHCNTSLHPFSMVTNCQYRWWYVSSTSISTSVLTKLFIIASGYWRKG